MNKTIMNGLTSNNEKQEFFLIMMNSIRKDSESFPDPFLIDFLTDDDFADIAKELSFTESINNENQEEYWISLEKCLVSRQIHYIEDLSDDEYQKYIAGNLSKKEYFAIQKRCYGK